VTRDYNFVKSIINQLTFDFETVESEIEDAIKIICFKLFLKGFDCFETNSGDNERKRVGLVVG